MTTFIQFNCNGIQGQATFIRQMLVEYKPKLMLLQELKLMKNVTIKFKGYTLITKSLNENSCQAPSVGILIKNGIHYERIVLPNDWCVIGVNLVIGCPMSVFSYYDNININKLSSLQLSKLVNYGKFESLVMGDFNAHSIMWDPEYSNIYAITNLRETAIINFLNDSDYVILNDGSVTRISSNFAHRNSAIDLTIVNKKFEFDLNWKVSDEQFGSDHLPIFISFKKVNFTEHKRTVWNLKSTDWCQFNNNCLLNSDHSNLDLNDLDTLIDEQILKGLKASTKAHIYPNNKKRSPPWYDMELDALRKEKNQALKSYIKSKSKEDSILQKKT